MVRIHHVEEMFVDEILNGVVEWPCRDTIGARSFSATFWRWSRSSPYGVGIHGGGFHDSLGISSEFSWDRRFWVLFVRVQVGSALLLGFVRVRLGSALLLFLGLSRVISCRRSHRREIEWEREKKRIRVSSYFG